MMSNNCGTDAQTDDDVLGHGLCPITGMANLGATYHAMPNNGNELQGFSLVGLPSSSTGMKLAYFTQIS